MSYFLWLSTLVYGLHIVEEMLFDWRGWARGFLRIPAEWNEFYVFNAFVVLYGSICAIIGWDCPALALSFPAFMLINALLFHVIPTIVSRRFSPGTLTAVVLFLPVAILAYKSAMSVRVISPNTLILSALIGACIMFYPIVLQKLKLKACFKQFSE